MDRRGLAFTVGTLALLVAGAPATRARVPKSYISARQEPTDFDSVELQFRAAGARLGVPDELVEGFVNGAFGVDELPAELRRAAERYSAQRSTL